MDSPLKFFVGVVLLLICLGLHNIADAKRSSFDGIIRMPTTTKNLQTLTEKNSDESDKIGTRWAILVAGSAGYGNYRHQADVCHAYQILRRGGLKEENIVVFMYDDIAYSPGNPRPGIIINHPQGENVYAGVPKDYTGNNVSVNNFFAVLLGDKTSVKGGSGKVVDSGPNDHIFIYYTDHGGPGVLGEEILTKFEYTNLKHRSGIRNYQNPRMFVHGLTNQLGLSGCYIILSFIHMSKHKLHSNVSCVNTHVTPKSCH